MGLPDNRGRKSRCIFFQCNDHHKLFATIIFLIVIVNCRDVQAEVKPTLDAYLHYNDNVTLAPPGMEQSSIITEIKPGLIIEEDGRRFDALVNYDVQLLHFAGDVSDDKVYHQLNADTTTTLVPELFYLDARATYNQQFIDPLGAISLDNLSLSDNIADVSTYTISPYVRQRYGVTATGEYRIGYQNLTYHGDETISQSDTQIKTALATIESGPRFDDLTWRLFYSYRNVKPDNNLDTTFQLSYISLSHRVSPKLRLIGDFGYEDNYYARVDTSEVPSGAYWAAGFGWNPSIRTVMEAKFGERYFGNTASFIFNHRTRRTTWQLEYLEDILTTAQLQVDYQDPQDPSLPPLPNPILSQTVQVILLERFTFVFTGTTAKTVTSLRMYNDFRTYQEDNEEEEVLGSILDWRWNFQARTSMVLNAQWYQQKYTNMDRVDKTSRANLSLERRIFRSMTGVISYGWLNRGSTDEAVQYDRNLISIGIQAEF